jgi:hypothetical protein
MNNMAKLTLKQKKAGAVNVYEVKLTVHVHHRSEAEAVSYLRTALYEWAVEGEIVADMQVDSVAESSKRYFVDGVVYPEDIEECQ